MSEHDVITAFIIGLALQLLREIVAVNSVGKLKKAMDDFLLTVQNLDRRISRLEWEAGLLDTLKRSMRSPENGNS